MTNNEEEIEQTIDEIELEESTDETDLKLTELIIMNERLDELLEIQRETDEKIELFKGDFESYRTEISSESSEPAIQENELIVLQSIDEKLTTDESIAELSMYADLGILLILALITIGFTFSLIKYVFNSLTRHIR